MLVLNPCANDARVLRSARTLAEHGAEVRVFALGNSRFPEGLVSVDGVDVQRLEVRSWFVRAMGLLRSAYLGAHARLRAPRPAGRPSRWHLLAVLVAPLLLLVRGAASGSASSRTVRPPGRTNPAVHVARRLRRLLAHGVGRARRRIRVLRWRSGRGRRVLRHRAAVVRRRLLPRRVDAGLTRWRSAVRSLLAEMGGAVAQATVRRPWSARRRRAAAVRTLRRRRLRRRRRVLRQVERRRRLRLRRRRAFLRRVAVARARRRALRAAYLLAYRAARRTLLPIHRPTTIRAFWTAAEAAMGTWEPDVAHAHDLNTLVPASRIGKRLGIPVVYDSHELWRHRNRHGQLRPLGRLADVVMERRLAPSVDAVITVSPSIATWLQRTYRLRAEVHVVRNTPHFQRTAPSRGVLERAPGERVVVYSGRFTSGRGLEDMIDALTHLPPDVVLAAVGYGDDEYVGSLRRRAAQRRVSHRVRLLGPVEPHLVAAAVSEGDLALVGIEPSCLSYRYALPNKLFEAIQARVPIVGSDLPDIGAVMRRYAIGELYRPGDPRSLSAAVLSVLASPGSYRAATAAAAMDLCWEREMNRLLDCYATVGVDLRGAGAAPAPQQPGAHALGDRTRSVVPS